MLMKLSRRCLALAITMAMLGTTQLQAAGTGSAYDGTMSALSPTFYFPLDEAAGTASGTILTNLGSGSAPQARYVQVTGSIFNDGTLSQGTGSGSYASVGATVGPTVQNKFIAGNTTATIAAQHPGFNPDFQDPAVYDNALGGTINRVFEANARGAIQLNQTNNNDSHKAFHGDPTTGAFTIAMWVRNEDLGSGQFPRLFEAGGDNTNTGGLSGNGNGNFLQLVAAKSGSNGLTFNTGVTVGKTVQIGYAAPGLRTGGEGIHNDGQWTFIVASVMNDPNMTPEQRANTIQIWERDRDATHLLTPGTTPLVGTGASNRPGIAKIGYRDGDPGAIGAAQTVSDKMDEVAIWNRILQYDEREAMFVSATRPSGGLANGTTADGSWVAGANWSFGNYPQPHGNNNISYMDVTVNHNMTVQSASPGDTAAWRTNMYNMTVNNTGSLAMNPGTVLRTADNTTLNGNVTMNGAFGTIFGINVSPEGNSKIDIGKDGSIGAVTVTMATPRNEIIAEENLTINPGASFVLNGTTGAPGAGAHLYRVAQADYDAGSGSLISGGGALTGQFGSHSLPAGLDGTGRRASVLYENRAASGVGTVDTMKVGLARPGDTDFNGTVDFTDAFTMVSNYGFSGMDWRDGYFQGTTGTVGFTDAFELTANYGFSYATTPGAIGDQPLSIIYDQATGILTVETTNAPGSISGINLTSSGNLFIPGVANWIGQDYSFSSNTAGQQGYTTLSAFGDTFFTGNGYVIGAILAAGLDEGVLLSDLTISYSVTGFAGVQTGDLIFQPVPEPSTVALLAIGLIGLVARRRRSAC